MATYQQWANGTAEQKSALNNKQEELNEAIQWLQANQKTPEQLQRELEDQNFLKGAIWKLPVKSWADKEVKKISNILAGRYQEDAKSFPDGDKNKDFHFSRAGGYDIYFPPSLEEFYKMGEKANQSCKMLTEKEDLIWSKEIEAWYHKVINEKPPWRGKPDSATKKDNNAIFFGAPGTGKTATVKKICVETDECPLVILKGSSLTPTKQDYDAGVAPLQKFIYTISELEWKLVKTYGLERESNGEIRYILFVDECDQISNNSLIHDSNRLRFLKELLEGSESSRKEETQNLWIFATNHLKDVESATYREGRLSNPLDFSWTWGEFLKYFDDASSNPEKYKLPPGFNISPLPKRWREEATLNEEDNKLVNKFNKFSFVGDFLGHDPDKPSKKKFWELFITNNPDAQYETEEDETDDQGNPTGQKEKIEVEIGEFLQFFWQKKESGQLSNYEGEFKSPRDPKVEEVLDNNLPNLFEIARVSANFSNALTTGLENLTKEVESIRQHVQANMSSQNSSLQLEIQQLRQSLADLSQEIHRRN